MAEYITHHWNSTYKEVEEVTETDNSVTPQDPVIPNDNNQAGANNTEEVIVIVILCIFSVVGTLGNGLVLYVFSRTTGKLTSTIFILALAGTDFVTCLVIIPYTVIAIYLEYLLVYDILCKVYQFLITCPVPLSAFIMVAIAVDRYLCICHPFAHIMTVKRAKIVVGVLALFATILGLITALGFSVYAMQPRSDNSVNSTDDRPDINIVKSNTTSDHFSKDTNTFPTGLTSNTYSMQEELPAKLYRTYTGLCYPTTVLLSDDFTNVYQKVYSAFFLCSLLIVLILYGLIYSSVTKQRAKRRAQKMGGRVKQVNTHCQTDESTIPLTSVKHKTNSNHNNVNLKVEVDGETTCTKLMCEEHPNGINESDSKPVKKVSLRNKPTAEQNKDKKDHDRLANIKTAIMLFIVTIVFIVAFLPAWLMAHRWLQFNTIVFYMYFIYNVANPVIYAFMNQMFRENMCRIFNSCRLFVNMR